jgi:UDP-GlcNAc3NAcA epimerase
VSALTLAVILGARPQFIKAAALSRAVRARNSGREIREVIIHSGQHYDLDMSEVFFQELDIPRPAVTLAAREPERTARFAAMLGGLDGLLRETKPAAALVFGDTDTTLAGALAAVRTGTPLAHVEAGLRSFNRLMPEESNRILPTIPRTSCSAHATGRGQPARRGLRAGPRRAGSCPGRRRWSSPGHPAWRPCATTRPWPRRATVGPRLAAFAGDRPFALCTIHRDENTAGVSACPAARALDRAAAVLPLVLPLHPGTRKRMEGFGLSLDNPRILVLPPQGFTTSWSSCAAAAWCSPTAEACRRRPSSSASPA